MLGTVLTNSISKSYFSGTEDKRYHIKREKKLTCAKLIKKVLTSKLKLTAVLEKKVTFVLKIVQLFKKCFIFKLTRINDSYDKEPVCTNIYFEVHPNLFKQVMVPPVCLKIHSSVVKRKMRSGF